MAFALVQTHFLGLNLKYGVWLYGLLCMAFSAYFIAKPVLTTQDWIAFAGICSPATALFVMQVIFPEKFAYAWANWYFSFVAYLLCLMAGLTAKQVRLLRGGIARRLQWWQVMAFGSSSVTRGSLRS